MSCCFGFAPSDGAETHLDDLKVSASNFGLDVQWVADLLAKYGPTALALAVEAMRLGFSKEFVMELFTKFGPMIMELLVQLWNSKLGDSGEIVTGDVVVADQVNAFLFLLEKYLPVLIDKYLPALMEKYGKPFVQMLVQAIIDAMTPKQAIKCCGK